MKWELPEVVGGGLLGGGAQRGKNGCNYNSIINITQFKKLGSVKGSMVPLKQGTLYLEEASPAISAGLLEPSI